MVGSFEFFRKYQRSLLVFVAILAMLAFFVLPPFLQMGDSAASQDPVAGMDGKASRDALIQYQNSFKTPPPAVNVINLGATLGR
jgi:hypothetical protein